MGKAICLLAQHPRIMEIHEPLRLHAARLKEEVKAAKEKYAAEHDKIWAETARYLVEAKLVPADFNLKKAPLQVDEEMGTLNYTSHDDADCDCTFCMIRKMVTR